MPMPEVGPQLRIRRERPGDETAIRRVNDAAFGQREEGEIVDRLRRAREAGGLWLSLVAEVDGEGDSEPGVEVEGPEIVGHILFTEVTIRSTAGNRVLGTAAGLAPMAVLPAHQRRGIGSRLVREGLVACRAAGQRLAVVLGHPAYYPRFGFVPAERFGLAWEHEAPSEAFLALELAPGAAAGLEGTVSYRPEFG